MKLSEKGLIATTALLFSLPLFADDEYDHYKGKPVKSLEQAVAMRVFKRRAGEIRQVDIEFGAGKGARALEVAPAVIEQGQLVRGQNIDFLA